MLLNQCPHQLDLVQWLCGMPYRVRAFLHEGKWHDIEVEDDVTAYLEYPNGATGVFITSTGDAPGTNRLEISGDMGKIVCENDEICFYKHERPDRVLQDRAEGFTKPEYGHRRRHRRPQPAARGGGQPLRGAICAARRWLPMAARASTA